MQNSYLYSLSALEDLEALIGLRLDSPDWQARRSTDATQILRFLMRRASVDNLAALERRLVESGAAHYNDGYLKQYWNWSGARGNMRSGPIKKMTIANVLLLLRAACAARITRADEIGGILIDLDREEMLGALASRWRGLKYLLPESAEEWERVWKLAEIEADAIWARRDEWHRNAVTAEIETRAREDAFA